MDGLLQDVRFALRGLRKSPGFAAVAILTLALGIGPNAALFSVVNAALRGWSDALEDPERLLMVWKGRGEEQWPTTPADFHDWREQNTVFTDLAAFHYQSVSLTAGDLPDRALAAAVSPRIFSIVGVRPLYGRGFDDGQEQWGRHRVALLSHGLWKRTFGADPSVVGRSVRVNGEQFEILGVMPPGAWFDNSPADLWIPLAFSPTDPRNHRNSHFLQTVGRLRPGASKDQASAEMVGIASRLARQYPENTGTTASVTTLRESTLGDIQPRILLLLGAVGLVLLIGCANVANLLLARGVSRTRELAVRRALGAPGRRILRQMLTESVVLAGVGGALGLVAAQWCLSAAAVFLPNGTPRIHEVGLSLDGRVLAFTLVLSILTGVLFGCLPALQALRVDLMESLKEGGRSGGSGLKAGRARGLLVVSETALAVLLLVGTGLLLRSFLLLQKVEPGVRPDHLLTANVSLPWAKSTDREYVPVFFEELVRRVESIPGVVGAGVSSHRPLGGGGMSRPFSIEGRPVASRNDVAVVSARQESANSLQALGVPLRRGRFFAATDDTSAESVAIVNETLARRQFPDQDAIGQHVLLETPEYLSTPDELPPGGRHTRWRIVGVVGDVRYQGLNQPPEACVYVPYLQRNRYMPWAPQYLVVQTAGEPMAVAGALRAQLAAVDKDLGLASVLTIEDLTRRSLGDTRNTFGLLAAFGGLALLLAVIGLYGVISYSVSQRSREMGIRSALGAQPGDIVRMVLGWGMRLVAVGIVGGAALSVGARTLMASVLYGVAPGDPIALGAAVVAMGMAAALASLLPARRAAHVLPLTALRDE